MGRNLVICCDGTNNQLAGDRTNVARMAAVASGVDDQLVYYDPGVGTMPKLWSRNKLAQVRDLVLGLATGSTPVGIYDELVRLHREEGLSFANVITFNLDEYLGLPPDHPASYRRFMDENLFDHINIAKANTRVPDGMATDIEAGRQLTYYAAQKKDSGQRSDLEAGMAKLFCAAMVEKVTSEA